MTNPPAPKLYHFRIVFGDGFTIDRRAFNASCAHILAAADRIADGSGDNHRTLLNAKVRRVYP